MMARGLYLRWGVVVLAVLIIVSLSARRYDREVRPISPETVLSSSPSGPVRVMGRVAGGSLSKSEPRPEGTLEAAFSLTSENGQVSVLYDGEEPDNLRELKTLVVVGKWDAEAQQLLSSQIDLIPNFGFVIAAYLNLIPLFLFLFIMERKVGLLYNEIKDTRDYESEAQELD